MLSVVLRKVTIYSISNPPCRNEFLQNERLKRNAATPLSSRTSHSHSLISHYTMIGYKVVETYMRDHSDLAKEGCLKEK